MSPISPAETRTASGCSLMLRCVQGPDAREIFLSCQPPAGVAGARQQANAIYNAIASVLEAEGGGSQSIVSEMLFLRNLGADLEPVRVARSLVLGGPGAASLPQARIELEQAPHDERHHLEVLIQAVIPGTSPLQRTSLAAEQSCGCPECTLAQGLRVDVGEESRLYANALYGPGAGMYEQTLGSFAVAESLLKKAGMDFRDVARTWIHLREMDRDYAEFNRARREFFASRGIGPAPASTGIGGGLVPGPHDIGLSIYAVKAQHPLLKTVMTTPTLNEAPVYGSDFSRGMRVAENNKVTLFVSGTASLDETGKTVHLDDLDAQADRMLLNVKALLQGQGASYADVVSAITYVKHARDTQRLTEKLHKAGYGGFPHVLVVAPVCRPELLCETEVIAVLPADS